MKIGIIGTGWRAQGYMKVISLFSHRMEVSAVLAHSEKSAQEMEIYFPGKVERNLDEFLKRDYGGIGKMLETEGKISRKNTGGRAVSSPSILSGCFKYHRKRLSGRGKQYVYGNAA